MKAKMFYSFNALLLVCLLLFSGCKKDNDSESNSSKIPILTTSTVVNIAQNTASCGGVISSDGGSTVIARGVCWSTGQTPTISDSKTNDGVGAGNFTSSITNLIANTTYYVRAYATNVNGTGYGSTMSFTTLQGSGIIVYVAGTFVNSSGIYVATLWKNGQSTYLTNGTRDAYAWSVFVNGSDVYVAGEEYNSEGHSVAKYWKNGVAVSLSNGTTFCNAESIFVSGSDVYVAGYDDFNAVYWKNGVVNKLTDGSEATSIFVVGSDVYVCGDNYYWKNGNRFSLESSFNASSVFVIGSDVFIGGEDNISGSVYYKNGSKQILNDGEEVSSVYVAGNDVYASGYSGNCTSQAKARYWKNGVSVDLTNGSNEAYANGIWVYGTDVYVVGEELTSNGKKNLICWKNGEPTILASIPSDSKDAGAISVVVK